ncbi:hypothetical protein AB5N19_11505 [Seiridium cardinale]|uniref:Zn(2)-C6 fungal-type domain-containing protein n=1 Tax=Seiridium cardinale TaxID=138064 RepID=A0ABR2XUS7_9PEZI
MTKVKCNFKSPCLRCTNKGLECVYDTAGAARGPATSARKSHAIDEQPSKSVELVFPTPIMTGGDVSSAVHNLYTSGEVTEPDEAQVDVDWNTLDFLGPNILS